MRDRVLQIDDRSLPFRSETFDLVAAINFLEHIKDDGRFFAEMVRVLKPGGDFLFMAPKGEHGRAGFALKRVLGFTADQEGFGHARDGYPPARRAVADGEPRAGGGGDGRLLPALHRVAGGRPQLRLPPQGDEGRRTPRSRTSTATPRRCRAEALNKVGTAYKVYSAVYPALRAWTMLDHLIPVHPGLHAGGLGPKGGLTCAASSVG